MISLIHETIHERMAVYATMLPNMHISRPIIHSVARKDAEECDFAAMGYH